MPNYMTSRLTAIGKDGGKLLKKYMTPNKDDPNYSNIDFNKIIPMPKDLEISSSSVTNKCVAIYLTSLNPDCTWLEYKGKDGNEYFRVKKLLKEKSRFSVYDGALTNDEIKKFVDGLSNFESDVKTLKECLELGEKCINNIDKYGEMDWYHWCVANWGTKWNAFHGDQETSGEWDEIYFDTAWSDVRKVVAELAKQNPDYEIIYEYAEEQIGCYVGKAVYKNGKCIEDVEYEDLSKEAYELAIDIHNCESEFKFNPKTNTYEYDDNLENKEDGEME